MTYYLQNQVTLPSIPEQFFTFFYRYIITHTLKHKKTKKQHKNTITRYKYIGSTWEKHKKKFLIKKKIKLTKNN